VRMLVIGAHPDDIEIGAGALVAKAVDLGMDVHFLVLTDDPVASAERRAEAMAGAEALGVPADRLLFAGLADGSLRADGETVRSVRELLADNGVAPDIVVTHTQADSHNDHVEANRLSRAVFRGRVFLHYSIHLSGELDRFAPRVFVEVAGARSEAKHKALSMHCSQRDRIEKVDLVEYEAGLGALAGLGRAEGFEVGFQNNADGVLEKTIGLSDSPFHRFWAPVVGGARSVTLLYEAYSAPGETIDWPTVHENAGRDRLRQAFADHWAPSSPLQEKFSNSPDAADIVRRGTVVLAGGAVSNPVVRDVYNRLRGTVWAIEYDLPRSESAFLLHRPTATRRYPEFTADRGLTGDVGVLALVPNPYAPHHWVLAAAGATGFATRVGLEFLADPGSRPELAALFAGRTGVQVAFTVDAVDPRHPVEIIDVHLAAQEGDRP
jgi:LmbE family N-acetylglucosaminyl deacetylase